MNYEEIKKIIKFLLKSKEFKEYEVEFNNLLEIGKNKEPEVKKIKTEYDKLKLTIQKKEKENLSIAKKMSNLEKKKTKPDKEIENLNKRKNILNQELTYLNIRLEILTGKIVNLLNKDVEFFFKKENIPLFIHQQSEKIKEKEYKLYKLIKDEYIKYNECTSFNEIDEEKYNEWAKTIITICNQFDNVKKEKITLLSNVIKTLCKDVMRNKEFMVNENLKIWSNINLNHDEDEGIGDSINSDDLHNQLSTSGYIPPSI